MIYRRDIKSLFTYMYMYNYIISCSKQHHGLRLADRQARLEVIEKYAKIHQEEVNIIIINYFIQ